MEFCGDTGCINFVSFAGPANGTAEHSEWLASSDEYLSPDAAEDNGFISGSNQWNKAHMSN